MQVHSALPVVLGTPQRHQQGAQDVLWYGFKRFSCHLDQWSYLTLYQTPWSKAWFLWEWVSQQLLVSYWFRRYSGRCPPERWGADPTSHSSAFSLIGAVLVLGHLYKEQGLEHVLILAKEWVRWLGFVELVRKKGRRRRRRRSTCYAIAWDYTQSWRHEFQELM